MISDTIEHLVVRVKPVKIASSSASGNVAPGPLSPSRSSSDTAGASLSESDSDSLSLYLFSPSNALRRACLAAAEHAAFGAVMLLLVAVNTTVSLIEESVYASLIPAQWSARLDVAFCVLFGVEAAGKMVAHGFAFCGPKSYILDKWNAFDAVVWLLSYVSLHSMPVAADISLCAFTSSYSHEFLTTFLGSFQALVTLCDQYQFQRFPRLASAATVFGRQCSAAYVA